MKWDDSKTKFLLEQISSCYENGTLRGTTAVPRAEEIDSVVNRFNRVFNDKEKLNKQRIRNRMLVLTNKFKHFKKIEDSFSKGIDIRNDKKAWAALVEQYPACQEFEKEDFQWYYPMKLMYQGRYHSQKFKHNQRSFSDDSSLLYQKHPPSFIDNQLSLKLPPIHHFSDTEPLITPSKPLFPPLHRDYISTSTQKSDKSHQLDINYIYNHENEQAPVVAQAMEAIERMNLTSSQFAKSVQLLSNPQLASAFLYLSDEYKYVYLKGSGVFDD
jgi:hypothetical protein